MKWARLGVLFSLAVGACVARPTPPPSFQPPTESQELMASSDLSTASVTFDSLELGPFSWLEEGAAEDVAIIDGWLRYRASKRMSGWYSDSTGPLLYMYVRGPFMVEAEVSANQRRDAAAQPASPFTSTGLLIRDPRSATDRMRWVMYNIGRQEKFFGTEAKTTRDASSGWHYHELAGFRSRSTLYLNERSGADTTARLRMCRIGDEIRLYWKRGPQGVWTEERQSDGTRVMGNGSGEATPGVQPNGFIRLIRSDLPDLVQVGLIANRGGADDRVDGESRARYLRLQRVAGFDACLAE